MAKRRSRKKRSAIVTSHKLSSNPQSTVLQSREVDAPSGGLGSPGLRSPSDSDAPPLRKSEDLAHVLFIGSLAAAIILALLALIIEVLITPLVIVLGLCLLYCVYFICKRLGIGRLKKVAMCVLVSGCLIWGLLRFREVMLERIAISARGKESSSEPLDVDALAKSLSAELAFGGKGGNLSQKTAGKEVVAYPWPFVRNIVHGEGGPRESRVRVFPRDYPATSEHRNNEVSLSSLHNLHVQIRMPLAVHPSEDGWYSYVLANFKIAELSYDIAMRNKPIIVPLMHEYTPLEFSFDARGGRWFGEAVLHKNGIGIDSTIALSGQQLRSDGSKANVAVKEEYVDGKLKLVEGVGGVGFGRERLRELGLPSRAPGDVHYPNYCVDQSYTKQFKEPSKQWLIQNPFPPMKLTDRP